MIIQCGNCSRKFSVKDEDIPKEGRMVQCSNCSQKWFQAPIKIQSSIKSDIDENVSKTQFEASDGRTYKFMGSQWAELLRSGKTGLVAKRTIAAELNRLAGIAKPKKSRKRVKKTEEVEIESISKIIDPSSEQIDSDDQQKKGLGFFGYIILLTIITLSIIGILKTFQNELIMYFPETEYIFDKGENIFESMGYLITVIKDLIKSY
ncbi:MAG: zinc-ribbon domain-containing protein [Pelagibacteraceae bacterium]|nr:zinc-ribbon domain-containing protein [Pelagibacteraceae bacterium]